MADRKKTQAELMDEYRAKFPTQTVSTPRNQGEQAAAMKIGQLRAPAQKSQSQLIDDMKAAANQMAQPPAHKSQAGQMSDMTATAQMNRHPAQTVHTSQAKRQASQSQLIAAMKAQVGDDCTLPAMSIPRVASQPGRLANFVESFDDDCDTNQIVKKLAAKDIVSLERLEAERIVMDRQAMKDLRAKVLEDIATVNRNEADLWMKQSSSSVTQSRPLNTQSSRGSFGSALKNSDSLISIPYNGRLKTQASHASFGSGLKNSESHGSFGSTANLITNPLPIVAKSRWYGKLGRTASADTRVQAHGNDVVAHAIAPQESSEDGQEAILPIPTRPRPSVHAPTRPAPPVPVSNIPTTNAAAEHIASPPTSVELEPLTRMDRICIDLYFFKWRYITAGLAILAFISSIIAAINPPNLTLPHTTHGETFSLGLAQGVWLTASIAVCVVSIGIFAHLAWQDIRYKWPYVISQAFAVCTACFRRERSGDLENQVGGVNPIELQDMPAPAAPAAPSPPRPSTRNVAPFTPEDATVPSTPLPSTSRTAPVTPESQRLADFVFPFSPDQPKDEDEGVEMGGESGESSRDMV